MTTTLNLATTPILSQSYAVGQGYDVFGQLSLDSLIRPLFAYSQAGTQVFTFLGKEYLVPDFIVPVESTSTYFQTGTFESREGFQNQVAAHAGVEIGYGAFSGEMQASFSSEFQRNAEYAYTYRDFYSQLATLTLGDGLAYRSGDFQQRLADLPDVVTPKTLPDFNSFFNDFGAYLTRRVTLGASMQFSVAVAKSSNLLNVQIDAMMQAQYDALFYSGRLDASIAASVEWKSYAASCNTTIRAQGGNPALVAALVSIDPLNPSPETVDRFQAWVASAAEDPAVVDFALEGIWQLAGDKREVLQQAWEIYGRTMHPRLTIKNASERISYPVTAEPKPPIITSAELIQPAAAPASPCGWQVIVFDGTRVPDNQTALLDKFYTVDPSQKNWFQSWVDMCGQIADDLSNPLLSKAGNILVMATFGYTFNMTPTHRLVSLMDLAGAGPLLEQWLDMANPGSVEGNPNSWTAGPTCYIQVGVFGDGPDTGLEVFKHDITEVSAELDLYFYRQSFGGHYTLGPA